MRDVVEEIEGGWRIPLQRFVADRVQGSDNTHLRLLRKRKEAFVLVPVERVAEIEALAAAKAVVELAAVSEKSVLTIAFVGGRALSIPSDPDYENWEVRGPGDILVVATPGGEEPAIWDAKSRTYRVVDGKMVEVRGESDE